MFTVISYYTTDLEVIIRTWRGCPTQAIKKALGHAEFFGREITEIRVIGTARTPEKARQIIEAYCENVLG